VVIDFAQMTPGQMPPGLVAAMRGLAVARGQPPAPGRSATYGQWPNEQGGGEPQGSLVGEHVVRANYAPEIRFTLGPNQDFLAPLRLASDARTPGGAVQLGWNMVPNATGYVASVLGGGQDTVVAWTSAETQVMPFALPDFIPPAEAQRLVQSHALLGPQVTACAVPKEVSDAAQHAMVQLVAYGPEANFVYPPRPSDPKAAWNRQWAVKVRYRSATGGLLGMAMPGYAGAEDSGDEPSSQPPPEHRRPRMPGGLGGFGLPGF
jgi:hypothetical protein